MARTKKGKKMPPRAAKANGTSAKDRHKKDGIDKTIVWKGPGPAPASAPVPGRVKERRDRSVKKIDWNVPVPTDLVAQPDKPQVNATTKHQTILEFVENDKKKKLEFQITTHALPPPGFEFVPIGNPELTQACKDASREQGALMFIVTQYNVRTSSAHRADVNQELNRIGYHFRQTIVDEARALLGLTASESAQHPANDKSQATIYKEADDAVRDLFPRIPNIDRDEIVTGSFRLGANRVGTHFDLPLSRRVQLAVLAHIRHNYTRYDKLLKETNWENARKAVESLCLDYIVKWRGDEENGRDALDEVLREIIILSDDEDEPGDKPGEISSDGEGETGSDSDSDAGGVSIVDSAAPRQEPLTTQSSQSLALATQSSVRPTPAYAAAGASPCQPGTGRGNPILISPSSVTASSRQRRKVLRRGTRLAAPERIDGGQVSASRGFGRYQAVRDRAWQEAVERQRLQPQAPVSQAGRAGFVEDYPMRNGYPENPRYEEPGLQRVPSYHGHQDTENFVRSRGAFLHTPPSHPPSVYRQSYAHRAPLQGGWEPTVVVPTERAHNHHQSHAREPPHDHPIPSVESRSPRAVLAPSSASVAYQTFSQGSATPFADGFVQLAPGATRAMTRRQLESNAGATYVARGSHGSSSYVPMAVSRDDRSELHYGANGPYAASTRYERAPATQAFASSSLSDPSYADLARSRVVSSSRMNRPSPEVIDLRSLSPTPPPASRQAVLQQAADERSSGIVRVTNKFPRLFELSPPPLAPQASAMQMQQGGFVSHGNNMATETTTGYGRPYTDHYTLPPRSTGERMVTSGGVPAASSAPGIAYYVGHRLTDEQPLPQPSRSRHDGSSLDNRLINDERGNQYSPHQGYQIDPDVRQWHRPQDPR